MIVPDGPKLDGRVAVVTGAGSSGPGVGTGKAISVRLASEGARVVLVDIVEDRARETLEMIEASDGVATIVAVDLRDRAAADVVVAEAVEKYGGLDILINNAAIPSPGSILDATLEQFEDLMSVNLTAPYMLCRAAIPVMQERGGGSIVNVTSVAALRGQGGKGQAAYAASKAGLIGLMVDLADAHGKDGIRVNCIAPGIIDTPMRNNAIRNAGRDPNQLDLTLKTSLGIEGTAWDIADAALFLAGPEGRYITGVVLPVDGGVVARSH